MCYGVLVPNHNRVFAYCRAPFEEGAVNVRVKTVDARVIKACQHHIAAVVRPYTANHGGYRVEHACLRLKVIDDIARIYVACMVIRVD